MYKHCTTEESFLRQRQIEGCLLELMQMLPYPQITITHICDSAGISRKSFYRYFGSKEDCLWALIDHRITDGVYSYLPEHNRQSAIRELYESFFVYWKQQAPLLNALIRNDLATLLAERMMFHVDQEERDFYHYLGGNPKDSFEQVLFTISGLVGLIIHWCNSGFQKSPGQMADIMIQIALK